MGVNKMSRYKNAASQLGPLERLQTPLASRLSRLITNSSELAAHLGVSTAAISQYRTGANQPTLDRLCKIADFYGVSVDYLLGRCEDPSPNPDHVAACEFTGLCPEAVDMLHEMQRNAADREKIPALNALLTHTDGGTILDLIGLFLNFDYDCFCCGGEVFENVDLAHSGNLNGDTLSISPYYVKAVLPGSIVAALGSLAAKIQVEREAGQDNG